MRHYPYDCVTGLYIGEYTEHENKRTPVGVESRESPREPGVYLLPAGCTFEEPPVVPCTRYWKFNAESNSWTVFDIPDTYPLFMDEVDKHMAAIHTKCNTELHAISLPYSPEEKETWDVQVTEAKEVLKGNLDVILLPTLLVGTETLVELATSITTKNNTYLNKCGEVIQNRRARTKEVEDLVTAFNLEEKTDVKAVNATYIQKLSLIGE